MAKRGRPKKYSKDTSMMFRIEEADKKAIQQFCEVHQLTITRFYEKAASRLISARGVVGSTPKEENT